ncbi:hypothetical protein [Catalinimonas niigatensis]|uniref:hypothetical protein n=1 Tax=Catalinimonas niigatensis TaxID=1397264 RepID=UPI0026656531|nr:hypothetical protein [Catalinimonas niigatensis]WPP52215.1 hypothetical protein PZB72_07460 [Catalinimonas niigatensis]
MSIYFRLTILFLLLPLFVCCQENEAPNNEPDIPVAAYGTAQDLGELSDNEINEASGIAASIHYEDALWVHNDSGNDPLLFLINNQGRTLKTFFIQGIENRDWEDITIGPGPDENKQYIYLGEIGDNLTRYDTKFIYRIAEPITSLDDQSKVDTISNIDVIEFRYPEKTQNAEALMIDPITKDVYIIAKNLDDPSIYRLPHEQISTSQLLTLEETGKLNIESKGLQDLVTGGDISSDGLEVLIKTYGHIYHWKRENTQTTITDLLQSQPDTITYNPEPQGEAITFTPTLDGFYTLSEKRFGIIPHLFFYPRK